MSNNSIKHVQFSQVDYIKPPVNPGGSNKLHKELTNELVDFLENSQASNLLPINKKILIEAGKIRGQTRMQTPDAIHVATAVYLNCDVFLTNDKRIKVFGNTKKVIFSADHSMTI